MDTIMIIKTLRKPWEWDTTLSSYDLELFILDFENVSWNNDTEKKYKMLCYPPHSWA